MACPSIPTRWVMVIQCLCLSLLYFVIKSSFNVAIVCMVRTPGNIPKSSQFGCYDSISNVRDDLQIFSSHTKNKSKGAYHPPLVVPAKYVRNGDFDWTKTDQANLLAAVSYGYIATQVIGGWMARKYGTRGVMTVCMFVINICCLITPFAATCGVYFLFTVRVISGLFMGPILPAMYNLLSRWLAPLERSSFFAVAWSGFEIGNILGFSVSGFLCQHGFAGGWPSIFYIFGGFSMLWLCSWIYTVYNTPIEHPRISDKEKTYLNELIPAKDERDFPTPWLSMLTSPPFWGNAVAFFAENWVTSTLQLGQVVYMKEVLRYNMTQNGILTAVPYLASVVMTFVTGYLANWIQSLKLISLVNTRRLFQLAAFVPMGLLLIGTGFVSCENRVWAIVLLTLARTTYALCRCGFQVNPMDLAPRFCGEMVGILNTLGSVTGFITPLVTASLTPNGTQAEWRNVFYLTGGIAIVGTLIFCALARGEVQKWAVVDTPPQYTECDRLMPFSSKNIDKKVLK